MPHPPVQEPVEGQGMHPSDPTSKEYAHPAFGQIQASRVSGGTVLHGSDFEHNAYVIVRVHHSVLCRDHAHDWHFPRGEIVELALSEAQWATFVSSMNVGTGVPCTRRSVQGELMPRLPLRDHRTQMEVEFSTRASEVAAKLDRAIADIEGEIGTSLSGKKRAVVIDRLKSVRQELASNMPWLAKVFGEHMEHTVEKAKVEVNAYVQTAVMRAGLQAISGGDEEVPILRLTAGVDE